MVDSKLSVWPHADISSERRDLMKACLTKLGFVETSSPTDFGRTVYVSHTYDNESIKNALRAAGFTDPEFQIRVEYQRKWGFL